ncbi:glycosyltransferase [Dolichospermum sp. UHCC 0684]|jgi:glycosyltransferase involved in cell wall biosynthesis|uniref:glycosyltransferase n=1 Tax=unclassified Dolichospermum TaxID=2622029 RepID=UPI001446D9A4|nr:MULTISPECIES: glycosyltransferase [unclassified Dolichospermum]MEA5528545.1 glycosyltransferase [Dolichospermum sp. UHCC 0684]MTJ34525.1 glycosyltransferase [Dolichospermum sp. UHCC 0260]
MSKTQMETHPSERAVLHIMHNWGGGLERWVQDYCRTDTSRKNIVLKSIGISGIPGQKLSLYQHIDDQNPIRVWSLTSSIFATSIYNLDYYFALEEIISDFNVSVIMISSFIGHSLDILNTGIKTIIICHDYYPFCPAINIYFEKICRECKLSHLQSCLVENQYNKFFPGISASEWILIRKIFIKLILDYKITLVVPSLSVKTNLILLEPKFGNVNFVVIPHGIEVEDLKSYQNKNLNQQKTIIQEKLKILILGRLSIQKGLNLFKESYEEILKYADIILLGCGDNGILFTGTKGIEITAYNYSLNDLPRHIKKISPDIGLLLSVLPETFSYTLSELMLLGVPPLATKLGSFENRIIDELNGFLFLAEKNALIQKIKYLSENRNLILEVAKNLSQESHSNLQQMIDDYEKIITSNITEINNKNLTDTSLVSVIQKQLEETQLKIQQIQLDIEINNIIINNMRLKKHLRVPLSQKSKHFDYFKQNFFGIWEFIRRLAIKFHLFK